MDTQEKKTIEKEWEKKGYKLTKCFHCGYSFWARGKYDPYDCPICSYARGGD